MSKVKLENYLVKLFIIVENEEGKSSSGVVTFDTYSVSKLNAVLDVTKYINLDIIKFERAKQVNFNDDFTWYDANEYYLIRVVEVLKVDNYTK